MTILIDLVGSWFIRAMLVAVMLTLSVNLNNALYTSTTKASAKSHAAVVYSVVYSDLSKAGNRVPLTDTTFYMADSSALRFYADTNATGSTSIEFIQYQAVYNPTTQLYSLNRTVNAGTTIVLGKDFRSATFNYYDAAGNQVSNSWDYWKIRQVRLTLQSKVENMTASDSTLTTDFRVYPPNLL